MVERAVAKHPTSLFIRLPLSIRYIAISNIVVCRMRGEAAPEFTYVKKQLDYPRRSFIAGVFCFKEIGTWSDSVHALSAKARGPHKGERG